MRMPKAVTAGALARKSATKAAQKRINSIAMAMTSTIPNQETLDDILLREPDEIRRKILFEFMKPALRFPLPRCPEDKARIIPC